jgi:hypothetical protein
MRDGPSTRTPLMGLLDLLSVAQWDGLLRGGTFVPAWDVHSVHTPFLISLLDLLLVAQWDGLLCDGTFVPVGILYFCHSLLWVFLLSTHYPSWLA